MGFQVSSSGPSRAIGAVTILMVVPFKSMLLNCFFPTLSYVQQPSSDGIEFQSTLVTVFFQTSGGPFHVLWFPIFENKFVHDESMMIPP